MPCVYPLSGNTAIIQWTCTHISTSPVGIVCGSIAGSLAHREIRMDEVERPYQRSFIILHNIYCRSDNRSGPVRVLFFIEFRIVRNPFQKLLSAPEFFFKFFFFSRGNNHLGPSIQTYSIILRYYDFAHGLSTTAWTACAQCSCRGHCSRDRSRHSSHFPIHSWPIFCRCLAFDHRTQFISSTADCVYICRRRDFNIIIWNPRGSNTTQFCFFLLYIFS